MRDLYDVSMIGGGLSGARAGCVFFALADLALLA